MSAINFLNHPLSQFGLAGNSDQSLSFTQNYPVVLNNTTVAQASSDPLGQCDYLNLPQTNGTCTANATKLSLTNTNQSLTDKPKFKTGSSQLTFALKYYF